LISGIGVGTGPDLDSPNAVFVEANGDLLVTTLQRLIFRVDADNGNRTLLIDDRDENDPFPDAFSGVLAVGEVVYVSTLTAQPFIAQINATNASLSALTTTDIRNVEDFALFGTTSALVADTFGRAIIQLALPSGAESVISEDDIGSGPEFGQLRVLAIAPDNTIYVGDEANTSFGLGVSVVFLVDAATGNRSVVSGPDNGSGPAIGRPLSMTVDNDGKLVMIDATHDGLLIIDPETGNRTLQAFN